MTNRHYKLGVGETVIGNVASGEDSKRWEVRVDRGKGVDHVIVSDSYASGVKATALVDVEGRVNYLDQSTVPKGHELEKWNEGHVEEAYKGVML
tara:strand:+ start:87 stop:368 length:282 start_codon:yes stop_codon:yes gene_type:complete